MSDQTLTIVLADSDAANRHCLSRQLGHAGYTVHEAETGPEAMLLCDELSPDAVILDIHLPDADGYEVCDYLRHLSGGLDAVVVLIGVDSTLPSGNGLGQMVDFVGGDFFLAKPCDGHLLVALLDEELRSAPQPVPVAQGGFPTRVVWPTTRTHA